MEFMDASYQHNDLLRLSQNAGQPQGNGVSERNDEQLKALCTEFEKIMASTLVKNSMKSMMESDSESDQASGRYKEIALEQIGKFMGSQGVFGLADTLYEHFKQGAQFQDNPTPTKGDTNNGSQS